MDEEKAKAECLLTVMELLGQKIELETAQEKAEGGNGEFKNQFILARQLTKHDCSQERETILDLSNAPDVVLLSIMDQLTQLPDIIRCTRVCRRWKHLIEDNCRFLHTFSRKTLLPSAVKTLFRTSSAYVTARTLRQYDESLFFLRPYISLKSMKTLLKKLGKHLKVVVLDMILNNCPHCTEYAYTLYECVENKRCFDVYSKQMNVDPQLFLENFLSVSEYDSRFQIDDEFVDIFRDMPNLKWLNLFNVEINNNCLIRLADAVGDRLEALVLGYHKRDGTPQSITSLLPELLSKFTSLRYFALPPCENGYCDPRAVISCLPTTITHLDLYGDRPIIIDSAVGKLAEITPHLKFLSINVHSSVDMVQLNRVAKKLERLCLWMFHRDTSLTDFNTLIYPQPSSFILQTPYQMLCAPNLKSLEFDSTSYVTDDSDQHMQLFIELILKGVVAHSKYVTDIKIRMAQSEQDESWDNVENPMVLNQARSEQKESTVWESLQTLKNFKNLEVLTLLNIAITDASLIEITKHGRLRELSLSGVSLSYISGYSILHIVQHCHKSLRFLDINQLSLELCEEIFRILDETRGQNERPFNNADKRILVCTTTRYGRSNKNLHPWLQWTCPGRVCDTYIGFPSNSVRLSYEFGYDCAQF